MALIDADLQAAFEYTFPLYEMARTRWLSVELSANPNRGINRLVHRRTLLDHRARAVTTPNNDTLYTSAWLDLSQGPIEVTVPNFGPRYWSFHFMDAYTSTAQIVGSNNAGAGDIKLWLTLPGDTTPVPAGARALRLPTRDVWMLVRILVDDLQDALLVHKMQDAIALKAVNSTPGPWTNPVAPSATASSPKDGSNYLDVVNSMLARNPVPENSNLLGHWLTFGVSAGTSPAQEAANLWTAQLPGLNQSIRAGLATGSHMVQGWQYPSADTGTYGTNFALRAGVALAGLGALPPSEAVYLSAVTDSKMQALTGAASYRVRVPGSGIPAKSFWSLTMYQIEPDGRLFFTDNPINRYAVGDRTPGMVKNSDGSMDIVVQNRIPADEREKANWLPAPSGGFRMILRAYLPTDALRDGKAALPLVERLQ